MPRNPLRPGFAAWTGLGALALLAPPPAVAAPAPAPAPAAPAPAAQPAPDHAVLTAQTRAVANRFLRRMFIDGNVRAAYDENAAEGLIQHNPHMADGLEAHRAFFRERFRQAGPDTAWANVVNMILVDGDLFAVHHHLFTGPEDRGRVFVDIWRVVGDRIVEHWDVIEPIPAQFANTNGVGCGAARDYRTARALPDPIEQPTCGLPSPTARRDESLAVLQSYVGGLRAGDAAAAVDRWLSADYRQHSPLMEDGKAGAKAFLTKQFGDRRQAPKMGPSRMLADGDFVLDHRLVTRPDGTQAVYVDIFRITGGQISEHWDVKQPVPAVSANANGMW